MNIMKIVVPVVATAVSVGVVWLSIRYSLGVTSDTQTAPVAESAE